MARIFQTGYESGDANQSGSIVLAGGVQGTVTVVSSAPTPRSGGYCLKCGFNNVNSNDPGDKCVQRYAHASKTEVWYAFGLYVSNATEAAAEYAAVFRNFDGAGNTNLVLRFDAGTLRVYRATGGGATQTTAQLTLLGTASTSIAQATWALVDVRVVAATGATGTVEVWINNSQVINATAVATCQTTAATTEFELGYYRFGGVANDAQGTAFAAFDDVRVNDTLGARNTGRAGDEAIRLLVPTSAGDLTQLSRGGTDSGANWSQVDEVPASSADYVSGASVGLCDLYNTTDVPTTSISAVSVVAQLANSDGAAGTVYLVTKTGAGQSDGSAFGLTATWAYATRLLETDPADGAAWDSAKLAALQIGAKIAS